MNHGVLRQKNGDNHRFEQKNDEILFHLTSVPPRVGASQFHVILITNKSDLCIVNNNNNSEPYKFKYSLM